MDIKKIIQQLAEESLELVIGIETHVRLNTNTKLFCACTNQESVTPNQHICPVCTGQMGTLPAVNKEAIRKAIRFGKGLDASMNNEHIAWDRKHYDYPDQPKNYQLTQFHHPIISDGRVSCYRNDGSIFSVDIEQAHIEEDAAKLLHDEGQTWVDFNKSGSPLVEVVTKPCIHRIGDASIYAQYLQRIAQNLGISEANLEKGEFKSDVSVSLRKIGEKKLNPRTEIKNLNSFKFMTEAVAEEIVKQLAYYQEYGKPRPNQTTVLWNEETKQTKTMRTKEFATDYRYLLEPDIPFVNIVEEVKKVKINKEVLPFSVEKQMIDDGVLPQDAKFFTADATRTHTFLKLYEQIGDVKRVAKLLSNHFPAEFYGFIEIETVVQIMLLLDKENVTPPTARQAILQLQKNKNFNYQDYFSAQEVSAEELLQAMQKVIQEHASIAEEIRQGNDNKAGILVGKVLQQIGKGMSGKQVREQILLQLADKKQQAQASNKDSQSNSIKTQDDALVFQKMSSTLAGVKEVYRKHIVSDITEKQLKQQLTLSGWVASVRDHGELVFIDLRDSSYEVLQLRLDRKRLPNLDELSKLKTETVVSVEGELKDREKDDYNHSLRTGKLELDVSSLVEINPSIPLPFEIKRAHKANEKVRYAYKYLDHRNEFVRKAILNRHRVIKYIRDELDGQKFLEIETPILTAGTDEGAREFIVPNRQTPGSFYTLPQAPQQFKQMLMVGGFEKYFQIARCFRDEDSRGDRQPEFTQLDLEMAFVNMQEVMDLNTNLLKSIVTHVYGNSWKMHPCQTITYSEAMQRYGTDRPDVRFGLEMQDITAIVRATSFQVFSHPIAQGGVVKCIKVDAAAQKQRISKGQIEKLTSLAQQNGLGGLAYIFLNEEGMQSPIIKFLGEDIAQKIVQQCKAKLGDVLFFSASDMFTANKALSEIRLELGKQLQLIPSGELRPVWVIDFPLFEPKQDGGWTFSHNPFSMPRIQDIENHINGEGIDRIISQQYDLTLNGHEIAGGSIRAHRPEILEATFRNMGYSKEKMIKSVGKLHQALHFGAPPHGGIAWGVDRLLMILEGATSIRDVMAFPKTGSGEDLLFGSPSVLSKKKVNEMHIKLLEQK